MCLGAKLTMDTMLLRAFSWEGRKRKTKYLKNKSEKPEYFQLYNLCCHFQVNLFQKTMLPAKGSVHEPLMDSSGQQTEERRICILCQHQPLLPISSSLCFSTLQEAAMASLPSRPLSRKITETTQKDPQSRDNIVAEQLLPHC